MGAFLGSGMGQYKVKDVNEERDQLVDFYLNEDVQKIILEKSSFDWKGKERHIDILKRSIKRSRLKEKTKEERILTNFCKELTRGPDPEILLLEEKLRWTEETAEALRYENARLKTMLQDPKRRNTESEEKR